MPATRSSVNSRISGKSAGFATATAAPDVQLNSHLRAEAREYWAVTILLSLLGTVALFFFYSRNEILLSGDAVAHISIARRVFDSRTPGPLQLGSVWLPLPHLLTIPFILSKSMWQSGIGGSIVSVLSYVFAGIGLFRLLYRRSRVAAWIATALFAANPNVLYVQSTALNEPLYLACFIWAVVFFVEASQSLRGNERITGRFLEKGAMALTAANFTRYDGWFLACVCWVAFLIKFLAELRVSPRTLIELRRTVFKPLLLTALGPTLWMAYNLGVYMNPLDFANGPYSAKAIAGRTTQQGSPSYPGQDHLFTAAVYFVKAAQFSVGEHETGRILLFIAALGSAAFALRRDWLPIALLWSPLVFYSLSIAYGSVPIFVPVWWPFSYYNVRYGLELLPAIAAGVGLAIAVIRESWERELVPRLSTLVILLIGVFTYSQSWKATPVCLREVHANGSGRMELDHRLAKILSSLPQDSTVLAYTGTHGGAFQFAGFPLRRTINEGNLYIWDASLAHPAMDVDFVIAAEDDPVGSSLRNHPAGLTKIASVHLAGQSEVTVYETSHSH